MHSCAKVSMVITRLPWSCTVVPKLAWLFQGCHDHAQLCQSWHGYCKAAMIMHSCAKKACSLQCYHGFCKFALEMDDLDENSMATSMTFWAFRTKFSLKSKLNPRDLKRLVNWNCTQRITRSMITNSWHRKFWRKFSKIYVLFHSVMLHFTAINRCLSDLSEPLEDARECWQMLESNWMVFDKRRGACHRVWWAMESFDGRNHAMSMERLSCSMDRGNAAIIHLYYDKLIRLLSLFLEMRVPLH